MELKRRCFSNIRRWYFFLVLRPINHAILNEIHGIAAIQWRNIFFLQVKSIPNWWIADAASRNDRNCQLRQHRIVIISVIGWMFLAHRLHIIIEHATFHLFAERTRDQSETEPFVMSITTRTPLSNILIIFTWPTITHTHRGPNISLVDHHWCDFRRRFRWCHNWILFQIYFHFTCNVQWIFSLRLSCHLNWVLCRWANIGSTKMTRGDEKKISWN